MSGGPRADRAKRAAYPILTSLGPLLLVAGTAGAIEPGTPQLAHPLPALSAAASAHRTGDTDLERLLARLDADEKVATAELSGIGPKIEVTHNRMIARGRAYYRHVRAGLLPAGGGFDALVDYAALVERARLALERDLNEETALQKRRSELEAKVMRIRIDRAPLDLEREAMTRARTALAEIDERHSAFARAFESSSRLPDYVAIYGADQGPSDIDPRAGFRALKGHLPFPVAGRAEVHRVVRPRSGGPGLELVGASGTPVRSVAGGRVAFADRYDDYGLTLILDHGDHYYSLYANLSETSAHVGDALPSGSRVGTMGPSNDGRVLVYFEIRKGSDTIDPGPWLGL